GSHTPNPWLRKLGASGRHLVQRVMKATLPLPLAKIGVPTSTSRSIPLWPLVPNSWKTEYLTWKGAAYLTCVLSGPLGTDCGCGAMITPGDPELPPLLCP